MLGGCGTVHSCPHILTGEVVSINGPLPVGEYWLLTSGAAFEDAESGVCFSLFDCASRLVLCKSHTVPMHPEQDEQAPTAAKEKRVEKKHRVRGHDYTARHFHTVQICVHCRNPMFGLGKQGYLCRSMHVVNIVDGSRASEGE